MHDDKRGAPARADAGKLRVEQAAHVVDDHCAGRDRGRCHGGLVRVHRHERAEFPRDALDQRNDPFDLLRRSDGGDVRAPGLAADVDDVGAGLDELAGEREAGVEGRMKAGVGEAVRASH